MRPRWPIGLALTTLLLSASPGVATAAPPPAPADVPAGQIRSVTLVTGDRVTVAGERVTVAMGSGRTHVGYMITKADGHLRVTPVDALDGLRDGKLDPRLFDVTSLIDFGYDDARRADLPLLSQGGAGLVASGVTPRKLAKKDAAGFWAGLGKNRMAAPGKLWLDGIRKPLLDKSVPQIGAPEAWAAGYTGAGVTVAVLDTGIDASHPDFAGKISATGNFTDDPDTDDLVGHGTHVASTIAGVGPLYKGVAPDAKLAIGKVCVVYGCPESAILAGMRWATLEQHARVVNLSLGSWDGPEIDPLEEAVNTLTAQTGALFVVAAGNDGFDGSVGSPGTAEAALSVAAVDSADQRAPFSSRGPSATGTVKPEISAPGVNIVAARAAHGVIGTPVNDRYTSLSGTSMATPHVAGAAALLAGQHPQWTAAQLKNALTGSAKPGGDVFGQGAGRVDVARATRQSVVAESGTLDFGTTEYPHGDDTPVTRQVTYRNQGSAPVTLALRVDGATPTGQAAPAGMFTADPSVTVPAGGTATVTVTADTRVNGPDGRYTGRLIATGGDVSLVNAFTVHRERQLVAVTIHATAPDGWQVARQMTSLRPDADGTDSAYVYEAQGTVRVPPGRYSVMTVIDSPDGMAAVTRPVLDVTGPMTVEMDGRQAGKYEVSVPEPGAVSLNAGVGIREGNAKWSSTTWLGSDRLDKLRLVRLGPKPPAGRFASIVSTTMARGGGELVDSPYAYNLAWASDDLPSSLRKTLKPADLATVRTRVLGPVDPRFPVAEHVAFPFAQSLGFDSAAGFPVPARVGSERVEYYLGGDTLGWNTIATKSADTGFEYQATDIMTNYRPGKHYLDELNKPVFGPSVVPRLMSRDGDELATYVMPRGPGRAGWYGMRDTSTATTRTTLYRDGAKLAESASPTGMYTTVPPEAADYRVVTEWADATAVLSDRITTEWAFRSGHTSTRTRLPALAVQFSPELDAEGYAPAGGLLRLPVTVSSADGSVAKALTVEASFDDGVTWVPVHLIREQGGWHGQVRHPASGGGVSLRTTATGADGAKVTETIHNAYRTR
ncbi:serine protease [Longispora fulva]|uniref:Subtilisin family serine protease n=1 Tax=Longispora fulva TaxID=619741 RepID=A0A8J7GKF3_9ACTN|nr:S8 family serine peptidase [Longispora fulva]MBG6134549.1 subtilisin family serine protease [Longispora fulva]GIG61755.1 serine protease [Longispora fulva]